MTARPDPDQLARRYVAWLRRHVIAIVAGHLIAAGGAVYLIVYHLPLFADFSYLLPQDAPAVRDLRRLEARVVATETVLAVVQAPTPTACSAALHDMTAGVRALPRDLVEGVEDDDLEIRELVRSHLHLYVPLEDLEKARDALANGIPATTLGLRQQWADAQARLARSSHLSADGRTGLVEIRIGFSGTDSDRGAALIRALERVRAVVLASHPGVTMGLTGGVITVAAEHRAILNGIVMSSIVTALLVALVLVLFFRSARLLVLLVGTIALATTAAFGAAALTVGHLNAATAFLGAIIAGNGVNYGILLIARFLEERRGGAGVDDALAVAIAGTLRPTAIASLGAAAAYGALAMSSFKGFADFAVIGATGMLLCWIASYLLLPTLVLVLGRRTRSRGDTSIGTLLVKLFGFRQSAAVCAAALVLGLGAGAIVIHYIVADPFEYDIKRLRSEGSDAVTIRKWMKLSDDTFGRGLVNRMYIAADRPEQVPQIVASLKALDANEPPARQLLGPIHSILDLVPDHQAAKIAVLSDIRGLLGDAAIANLEPAVRAELAALRPPADLQPITIAALPRSIRARPEITETDGRTGLMISIFAANRLDDWNGHDMIEFANAVRRLELPDGSTVTTSGASVIFVDILQAIERDGPVVTAAAALGLVVIVVVLVGRNRAAVAVLVATGTGSMLMVAACALIGLRVNFLDFVALPIALGLGIDYAINVAHRHQDEGVPDPRAMLRTSGSAVFVCSLTTMIGYGSLLVSENLAIKGFATASLIGEIACVVAALVLVPAILALGARRQAVVTIEHGVSAA